MRKIKYIKSENFFAMKYKDGIIVAFKNIGDNSPSYADQIHQIVLKKNGVDLFVSDIIELLSGTNTHKEIINGSLFVLKKGVSISACGISICQNKDCIEVKYNSEKVLTVQIKRLRKLWCVCILIILCIVGIIFHYYTIDEPIIVKTLYETANDLPAPIETIIIPNSYQKHESVQDDEIIDDIVEVVETEVAQDEEMLQEVVIATTVPDDSVLIPNGIKNVETLAIVKDHELEYNHAVEEKIQRDKEETERNRQRKALKAEANEYVRIADQAYNDYADSFNESKGIVALTNYEKALELNKKHSLFFVSERKKIEQKVNILEKELK